MAASDDLVATIEGLARSRPALSVTANLSVRIDNVDLAISTVEDRIRVQVPSVSAGVRLLRGQREHLPRLSRVLSEAALTAEIRVGSAVVALAGADATPGRLGRVLSLEPLEVRPQALVAAVVRFR
ncbi:peptide ABC transporter ATP-binding protein [Halorhabdus rudnickae]|uniref:peptide ABC transporter ATP-binding protein n=1 Tax=Halorhabdus rudnickae TaxID=1775544 RepID=UPI001082F0A1|nr:peptide ABC transporter ATP-binding protein [Halorhabdus rudnickae]